MCVPLSPVQALAKGGGAGRAVKSALFPGLALAGAFDKKKPDNRRTSGGLNPDGSMSFGGG